MRLTERATKRAEAGHLLAGGGDLDGVWDALTHQPMALLGDGHARQVGVPHRVDCSCFPAARCLRSRGERTHAMPTGCRQHLVEPHPVVGVFSGEGAPPKLWR